MTVPVRFVLSLLLVATWLESATAAPGAETLQADRIDGFVEFAVRGRNDRRDRPGADTSLAKDELKLDWRETESQDIWNETYPNLPKSLWWYRDRFDMGFRLVCDPVNIPEAK